MNQVDKKIFLEGLIKINFKFDIGFKESMAHGFSGYLPNVTVDNFLKNKREEYHKSIFQLFVEYGFSLDQKQNKLDEIWNEALQKYKFSKVRRIIGMSIPLLNLTRTGEPEIVNVWSYYQKGILKLALAEDYSIDNCENCKTQ